MVTLLDVIEIQLPSASKFESQLLTFLGNTVQKKVDIIEFPSSKASYLPHISMSFGSTNTPQATFKFGSRCDIVPLANNTGKERKSYHIYHPIEMNEIRRRLPDINILCIDHLGINLPWFNGLHPEVLRIRNTFSKSCLYHLYPSGEAWDFILPGTEDEILGKKIIDYEKTRRPKFEIVSFSKCSTPLIQIEIVVNISYDTLKNTFSEGIPVDEVRQVWLYLENPFGVDFCIVLNEARNSDWSGLFKGNRIS